MIDVAYFTALIMVFLRITSFFMVIPILFPKGTPNTAKIALVGLLSFILLPGINYSNISAITNNYTFIMYAADEIITGLTLGYITNLCFTSAKIAGHLIDMQIGFSMISMFDPNTSSSTTLIENLLYWFSALTFFIIDGHHMLIKVLMDSFSVISMGKFVLGQESINLVIKAFTEFFAIGLKIAIPIILIMLITDLTMGLISRTVPQLNLMILGMPVKILIGLSGFLIALPIILKVIISSYGTVLEAIKGFYKVIPVLLIFASDDKTEEATPHKKSEARKKGQVPRSKEVGLTITLLTSTIVILTLGGYVGNNFRALLIDFLGNRLNIQLDYNNIQGIVLISIWRIALTFLPVVVPIMIMGMAASFMQTGFLFTKEPITPKLSKLNPLNGFKRMFSFRTFVEGIKDIAIVSIVGYVGYKFISDNFDQILNIGNMKLGAIATVFGKLVINIFFKITLVMLIISLADYLYQRFQHNKELKMTKQEIKEEFKQQEGNPEIKSKIRQKQRELASRRMMQQVPDATVVVTNPTHIAVALKYEEGNNEAPKLVAKGAEAVALKIKEIAKENDVPVIENKALARLIYKEVELDSEIPVEMYQAIAEILALVYKLKKKR